MPRSNTVRVTARTLAAAAALAGSAICAPAALADEDSRRPDLPQTSNAHDKRPDLVDHHGRKLG